MKIPSLAALLACLIASCSAAVDAGVPVDGGPLTIGVIADVQYADKETNGTRRYREALGKLEAAVEAFNATPPAFVVQLGDVVDGNGERTGDELSAVLDAFDDLRCELLHVVGNHCLDAGRAVYDERVELDSYHYAFERGDWVFIVLDGNDVSTRDLPEGSAAHREAQEYLKQPGNKPWGGAVGEVQLAWLEDRLADAARREHRVIVFCHFPILLEAAGGARSVVLWNHERLLESVADSACVAFIAGHHHAGGYGVHGGVHHLTLPAICDAPEGSNAFAFIDLLEDRLVVRGQGTVPGRELLFDIP